MHIEIFIKENACNTGLKSPEYDTKLHALVRLQFWRSGKGDIINSFP